MRKLTMKKWIGWDLGIVALVLGGAACGRMLAKDAFLALQIKQVQVLSGGDCTVPGTPTAAYQPKGTLDLDLPDLAFPPYIMPLAIANNLSANGASPAEEMNNITLTHFTVQLSAANVAWNDSCPATFDTERFTFTIGPGGSTGAAIEAITSAHSQCLYPYIPAEHLRVTAKVWAKGRHGGTSIESAPFVYPIDVCKGCLQRGYTEPALVPYTYGTGIYPLCSALTGTNPYQGDPCFPPGQDAIILCCGATVTVGGASQTIPMCPGVFTGSTATATATSTATTP
jgi:hypothetical protein